MEEDDLSKRAREERLQSSSKQITKEELQKIVQQIRVLSMNLSRFKPAEWNEFLDVAL
jgi:hypothetical protein